METCVLAGRRVCGSRPETANEVLEQSRASYEAFEKTMQMLSDDLRVSHEADEAYRALTTSDPRP